VVEIVSKKYKIRLEKGLLTLIEIESSTNQRRRPALVPPYFYIHSYLLHYHHSYYHLYQLIYLYTII